MLAQGGIGRSRRSILAMTMREAPRDPALFAAWLEFAESALHDIARHVDDRGREDVYEVVHEWRPRPGADDPWWVRRAVRKPWIWPAISDVDEDLQALPAYQRTLQALKDNAVIGPQVGAMVGTVLGSSRLAEDELIEGILQEVALRGGAIGFDEDSFRSAYAHIEGALYADHLQFKMVAPIFQAQFARLPLALGDGLEINEMSLPELNAVVSAGLMARVVRPDSEKDVFHHREAVMYLYRLPKRVTPATDIADDDDDDRDDHAEVMRLFEMTETVVDEVMRALRLVHHGAYSIPGAIHLPLTWFDEDQEPRADFLQTGSRHYLMTAAFSDGACDQVESIYRALNEPRVRKHRGVIQAVSRFSFALDKHRAEDRILDMMIAAEALFLSDAGGAADRGELKYRLSLRAAVLLGTNGREREQIFKFMKLAYDARSAIAHGGSPGPLRDPDGNQIDLELFTKYLDRYLRRAIKKAIQEAPDGGGFGDWERRILGVSAEEP